jgi:methylated-DNA-[protein]-cysteine S-methyltransferase
MSFDLPIEARGTGFQLRAWELIPQIPYGHTTTYGDLARRLGGEVNAQEAGAAVTRNPLCILIPCHRVIGSTGKLTGYAGGLKRKRGLLELEQGCQRIFANARARRRTSSWMFARPGCTSTHRNTRLAAG